MDYLKIYNNLMESRSNRELTKEKYFELHHIIPRCLGGIDDKTNLVKLTYKEHFIAHWLLIKIYPTEPKIHYAFRCMTIDPNGNRILTSRMISTVKRNYVEFKKWHCKISNPGRSINSRNAARKRMMSSNNPMKKNPEKNPFLGKSFVIGRKWYNNGIENKYLYDNDVIPDGFVIGMKFQKRNKG